ncbi:MAG: FAD-linked oxidase C-terminal domain-containing protein [Candidatus Firestonebacteria bacterium]
MEKQLINSLRNIFGGENVKTSQEELIAYSYDGYLKESLPEAVVFPLKTEEVVSLVKLANEESFYITSRGSGSNLCGASIPKKGGVVLCFSKMNKTIEINKEKRYATIQAGKILEELENELTPMGFTYPVDLGSSRIATIGGSIALNSGGMKALKYGVTRDYLLELEVVLADGRIIKLGTKTKKNVVGYDLMSLICGSEGTLGIVTQATVKILVKPETRKVMVAHFGKMQDACNTINEILAAGLMPAAMEIIDKLVIGAVEDYVKAGLDKNAEALVLMELDGSKRQVEEDIVRIFELFKKNNATRSEVARSETENENLWLARKSALPSMARCKPICIAEDLTVPTKNLYEVITRLTELTKKHGVMLGLISHSGDGNLHPHFLIDTKEEEEKADRILEEITPLVVSLGGTLSGEHGIGIGKKKFLGYQIKETELNLMKEVKKFFDPKGILNPGSFID